MRRAAPVRRPVRAALGLSIAPAIALAWLFAPMAGGTLRSRPHPVASWAEAVGRVHAAGLADGAPGIAREGRSLALLHTAPAETAVVIFHGYTNVPAQFAAVARGWFEAGANVWVPRTPWHGEADRMTSDLSKLTPERLRSWADSAIDVGRGLGRTVIVVGLSGGGALATWAAAERRDVAGAVVISPLLVPAGYRAWTIRPVARAVLALPDRWVWWNEVAREREPGPGYPRYSLHGIASYLMLGERARADASSPTPPAAGRMTLLVNRGDGEIDPDAAIALARRLVPPDRLRIVEIPAADSLAHDLVDPAAANAPHIRTSYAWLSRAMGVPLPDPLTGTTPH